MKQDKQQNGFSPVIAIIAVLVLAGVGLSGWYVWHNKQDDTSNKSSNGASQGSSKKNEVESKAADQYEGWQTYNNATYGISFKYPADWKFREGAFDSPDSATKQEYAIVLELKEEFKYNE